VAGIGRIRQIDALILNLADGILEQLGLLSYFLIKLSIIAASEKIFDFGQAKLP
jgi:hypothetical protein